jgi:hypothetical protein
MTAEEALAFIRQHGVVLASARGPTPRLVEVIAGGPIRGSWWAHPKGRQIFRIIQAVSHSPDVLVCRLVNRKLTFVHRRLWPALVRLADSLPADQVSQVHEEHLPTGRHVSHDIPFPEWVPKEILQEAQCLSEQDARHALLPWLSGPPSRSTRSPARTRAPG